MRAGERARSSCRQGHGTSLARLTGARRCCAPWSFDVPREQALEFGRARLRDHLGRPASSPSIDAPVALFFGAGTLYNRDNREYLVKAFPVSVRYRRRARSPGLLFPDALLPLGAVRTDQYRRSDAPGRALERPLRAATAGRPSHVGYFHATYRDHPQPEPGKDLVLLDTREAEGGGDWSGHLVGTSFIFSDRADLDARWRAIRGSSSTTARRRRPRAPAPRNGAAAATTGAAAT